MNSPVNANEVIMVSEYIPACLLNKPTYELFEAIQQIRHYNDYQNSSGWKIAFSISIGGKDHTIHIGPCTTKGANEQVIIRGRPLSYEDISNSLESFKSDQYNELDKRNKRMLINLRQQLIQSDLGFVNFSGMANNFTKSNIHKIDFTKKIPIVNIVRIN